MTGKPSSRRTPPIRRQLRQWAAEPVDRQAAMEVVAHVRRSLAVSRAPRLPVRRLGLAMAMLVAVLLWARGPAWFVPGAGQVDTALYARASEQVELTRTIRFRTTIHSGSAASQVSQTWIQGADLLRVERPDGRIQLTNFTTGDVLLLDPTSRTARWSYLPPSPEVDHYWVIRHLPAARAAEPLADVDWNNQSMARFRVTTDHRQMEIWIDRQKGWPQRILGRDQPPGQVAVDWRQDEFHFNEPLDPGLFSFEPPPGYSSDQRNRRFRLTPAERAQPPHDWPLEPGQGWGPVCFGHTTEQVIGFLGAPSLRQEPPSGHTTTLWYLADGVSLQIDRRAGLFQIDGFAAGAAWHEVHDFSGRTSEGIGLNATPAEIESAWGRPTKVNARDETTSIWAYSPQRVELELRNGRVARISIRAPRPESDARSRP